MTGRRAGSWLRPPRSSVANVVAITTPAAAGARRELSAAPVLFDQDLEPDRDRRVVLTVTEARAIAGLLAYARDHAPSPALVDEAVAYLHGHPSAPRLTTTDQGGGVR